jgi:large subunit ribosomal protein L13e
VEEVKRPIVQKPGGKDKRLRLGRGYSLGEIMEAGIDLSKAKEIGIYIDKRRRSKHRENIERLRELIEEEGFMG